MIGLHYWQQRYPLFSYINNYYNLLITCQLPLPLPWETLPPPNPPKTPNPRPQPNRPRSTTHRSPSRSPQMTMTTIKTAFPPLQVALRIPPPPLPQGTVVTTMGAPQPGGSVGSERGRRRSRSGCRSGRGGSRRGSGGGRRRRRGSGRSNRC